LAIIGKNFTILLMEDEVDLGETLQEMLEDEGYDVIWVKDGLEAADVSFKKQFDLYIFDINVPEFNGLELLESLRDAQDNTPAIFISAMVDLETIRKAFKVGAEDYLKKPFFPEELLLRIEAKFQQKNSDIIYNDLLYNPEKKELRKAGEVLFLSKKQQQLFDLFMTNLDKTLEPHIIMAYVSIKTLSALRVAINKLKQLTGIEIRSLHGVGYRLETC
jgi:DNA-binding response OmpR family regulator